MKWEKSLLGSLWRLIVLQKRFKVEAGFHWKRRAGLQDLARLSLLTSCPQMQQNWCGPSVFVLTHTWLCILWSARFQLLWSRHIICLKKFVFILGGRVLSNARRQHQLEFDPPKATSGLWVWHIWPFHQQVHTDEEFFLPYMIKPGPSNVPKMFAPLGFDPLFGNSYLNLDLVPKISNSTTFWPSGDFGNDQQVIERFSCAKTHANTHKTATKSHKRAQI